MNKHSHIRRFVRKLSSSLKENLLDQKEKNLQKKSKSKFTDKKVNFIYFSLGVMAAASLPHVVWAAYIKTACIQETEVIRKHTNTPPLGKGRPFLSYHTHWVPPLPSSSQKPSTVISLTCEPEDHTHFHASVVTLTTQNKDNQCIRVYKAGETRLDSPL